ncbi:GlsB/YeaQ/YmgE family stress response membrane protein, partial [Streptomyces avidinii]
MGIVAWILIGLFAGLIAKAIMPGKDPGGIIVTMLIGIVGGLLR